MLNKSACVWHISTPTHTHLPLSSAWRCVWVWLCVCAASRANYRSSQARRKYYPACTQPNNRSTKKCPSKYSLNCSRKERRNGGEGQMGNEVSWEREQGKYRMFVRRGVLDQQRPRQLFEDAVVASRDLCCENFPERCHSNQLMNWQLI